MCKPRVKATQLFRSPRNVQRTALDCHILDTCGRTSSTRSTEKLPARSFIILSSLKVYNKMNRTKTSSEYRRGNKRVTTSLQTLSGTT